MIEPKTPLPWKLAYDISYEEDHKYFLQACNNFPRAIELLKKIIEIIDPNSDDFIELGINEFLKEIE